MRVLVIGNPVAGPGRSEKRIHAFTRALKRKGHHVEVFLTGKAGDALDRARSINGTVDRLVIAGGDGTVNEVINGLSDPSRIPLLHLPTGTANQLARSLCLPLNPEALAAILEQGNVRHIDLGLANGRRFLLLVSAGFDAKVAAEVKKVRGDKLGYAGYALPLLKAAAEYCAPELHVVADGGERISGCNVMVLKVREYGGFFVFAEDARLDSGHFEVCVFRDGTKSKILLYALAGLVGRASDVPGLTRIPARRVRIESEEPIPVEVDGDHFGDTPVEIELLHSVVPVIVEKPI
jgi:diacylglycerol kinase (ATP)